MYMYVYFITDAECERLISLEAPKLSRRLHIYLYIYR